MNSMKSFLNYSNEDPSVHEKLFPIDFKLTVYLISLILYYPQCFCDK